MEIGSVCISWNEEKTICHVNMICGTMGREAMYSWNKFETETDWYAILTLHCIENNVVTCERVLRKALLFYLFMFYLFIYFYKEVSLLLMLMSSVQRGRVVDYEQLNCSTWSNL